MKTLNGNQKDSGLEITIRPNDLKVICESLILEGKSTAGADEVPYISYPYSHGPSNNMIQYDQHWAVRFNWTVLGRFACLLNCGKWKCEIVFEQMGERETGFKPVVFTPDEGQPGHRYQALIEIPPCTLKPGLYQIIACFEYCLEDGRTGFISGFEDKGLIKIFEDKRTIKPNSPKNERATAAVE